LGDEAEYGEPEGGENGRKRFEAYLGKVNFVQSGRRKNKVKGGNALTP